MTKGLTRARALKRDGTKNYKKLKKVAEASVATWQWATAKLHTVSPGWFECTGFKRGRKLPGKPATLKYHVQEGFDSRGRLVVSRDYVKNYWAVFYETFYIHEAGGISNIRFSCNEPKSASVAHWYTTDKHGRVTAEDSVFQDGGYASRVYRFDDRGHYAGYDETGVSDDDAFEAAMDIECDDTGEIVRTIEIEGSKRTVRFQRKSKTKPAKKLSTTKKARKK